MRAELSNRSFFFLLETARCSREDLEIIPSTGDVELGKKSYFLCKVRNGGEATLTWLDPNDNEIDADSEPYNEKAVDELSKGLEMTLCDPNLGGIFTCAGQFDQSGATARAQIRIRVIVTPRIQLPMAESSATQIGNPTQYNFTILANPSPSVTVSWKGKVFEGDDIKVVEEDQGTYMVSLQFMPTSQEDISELLITAINELGTTTKTVTLKEDIPDKGLGTGSILAIILAILLLLVLLVVDVSCYYRRQCGFLM
nr:uncharacterized protein LOC110070120 [Pogona vitticeps]